MTVTIKKRKFESNNDSQDILCTCFNRATIDDYGQKYQCDSCSKDITQLVICRCAECPDFDLCVECFSRGVETKEHSRNHKYRVIESLNFPIFEAEWGADEELLLVEALEQYGMGNWEQISDHVGTKNKLQCEMHYQRVYVNSPDWPLPDMNSAFPLENGCKKRARGPNYVLEKLPKCPRAPASAPVNHEVGGFMPGRKEFEQEYENEAEQSVKDMEFFPSDSPHEIGIPAYTELKCTMLNIYNTILDRRAERKAFVFDRNLVDFKKVLSQDKKRSKEERDLYAKLRALARLQTKEDFDQFMEGILAEQRIRLRISQLQEYRKMGITTLKEANEYEKEKAARIHSKSAGFSAGASVPRREHKFSGSPQPNSRQSSLPALPSGYLGEPGKILPVQFSSAAGSDLLSEPEKQICISLSIFPKPYLAAKDALLKEYAYAGSLSVKQAKAIVKLNPQKVAKLYDFFVRSGWIS